MSTHPTDELAADYAAIVGQPPDAGFADRVRVILSANGNPDWVPEYVLEALKHLAARELVAPTDVPPDLHGLAYYLGELAPLFPGAEMRDQRMERTELFLPSAARSVVVEAERWSVIEPLARTSKPHAVTSLGTFAPSPDQIRRWAHDPGLVFAYQDEDVAIRDDRHIPLLVELAADPTVVKRATILSVLDSLIIYGLRADGGFARLQRILDQLATLERVADETQQWATKKQRLREYLRGTGPITRDAANDIAHLLMIGVGAPGEPIDGWIHYGAPNEHLYIHLATGAVVMSRDALAATALPGAPGPARI